jgi:hypothetical protein
MTIHEARATNMAAQHGLRSHAAIVAAIEDIVRGLDPALVDRARLGVDEGARMDDEALAPGTSNARGCALAAAAHLARAYQDPEGAATEWFAVRAWADLARRRVA